MTRQLGLPALASLCGGFGLIFLLVTLGYLPFPGELTHAISTEEDNISHTLYLPMVMSGYVPPSGRLCRFGVGAGADIGNYAVNSLRIGWYVDWTATANPARPGGITYIPTIRLSQTGPDSYTYSPSGAALSATVASNPGAIWLIGNEPDRRYYQDDLEPHVYARAYHDLYYLIKAMDPQALIGAGGIVQPTPLRLQYLDLVLEHYRNLYGEPMPVDVWNIHAFILRERNCVYHPDDCWGADVPPGINVPEGMLYEIQDNDNIEIFKQNIERFRRWMAERGYQDRPLIITEFGVQMPSDYGFTPERVNAYMKATFDYLMTVTSTVGYPADEYRLVQRWAWYSLSDKHFNGWLFDPQTRERTVFGDHFASYTAQINPVVNLRPVQLWTDPPAPFSTGEPLTITLYVKVANSGHVATSYPVLVRFYEGDPLEGGIPIGLGYEILSLEGCGSGVVVTATWSNLLPGMHWIYVAVDPEHVISEENEMDNVRAFPVLIPTSRLWLPLVLKPQE